MIEQPMLHWRGAIRINGRSHERSLAALSVDCSESDVGFGQTGVPRALSRGIQHASVVRPVHNASYPYVWHKTTPGVTCFSNTARKLDNRDFDGVLPPMWVNLRANALDVALAEAAP